MRPNDTQLLDGSLRIFGFIPYGYTQHIETFGVILVVELLDVGNLAPAGTAPRSPEVDQHILALAHIVRERSLRAVGLLDGEVGKHLTLGCLFGNLETLVHYLYQRVGLEGFAGQVDDRVETLGRKIPVEEGPCTHGVVVVTVEVVREEFVYLGHDEGQLHLVPLGRSLFVGQTFCYDLLLFGYEDLVQRIDVVHKRGKLVVERSTRYLVGFAQLYGNVTVLDDKSHAVKRGYLQHTHESGIGLALELELVIGNHRAVEHIARSHIGQVNHVAVQGRVGHCSVDGIRRRIGVAGNNRCGSSSHQKEKISIFHIRYKLIARQR